MKLENAGVRTHTIHDLLVPPHLFALYRPIITLLQGKSLAYEKCLMHE
jgi:hypothetical protein